MKKQNKMTKITLKNIQCLMVKIMNINFLFHLEHKLIFSQESNLKTWKMRENWECENIENAILQLAGSTSGENYIGAPNMRNKFWYTIKLLILVFSILPNTYLLLFQLCDSNSWQSFSLLNAIVNHMTFRYHLYKRVTERQER